LRDFLPEEHTSLTRGDWSRPGAFRYPEATGPGPGLFPNLEATDPGPGLFPNLEATDPGPGLFPNLEATDPGTGEGKPFRHFYILVHAPFYITFYYNYI